MTCSGNRARAGLPATLGVVNRIDALGLGRLYHSLGVPLVEFTKELVGEVLVTVGAAGVELLLHRGLQLAGPRGLRPFPHLAGRDGAGEDRRHRGVTLPLERADELLAVACELLRVHPDMARDLVDGRLADLAILDD